MGRYTIYVCNIDLCAILILKTTMIFSPIIVLMFNNNCVYSRKNLIDRIYVI